MFLRGEESREGEGRKVGKGAIMVSPSVPTTVFVTTESLSLDKLQLEPARSTSPIVLLPVLALRDSIMSLCYPSVRFTPLFNSFDR